MYTPTHYEKYVPTEQTKSAYKHWKWIRFQNDRLVYTGTNVKFVVVTFFVPDRGE
jgi:hypothetical protein